MLPEVKKIIKTLQGNYKDSQDKEAFLLNIEKNRDRLAESPLILARNTPSQNHYQAFCLLLRIYKNRKMKKIETEELGGYTRDEWRSMIDAKVVAEVSEEVINFLRDQKINHTERVHALLSASGASRWIACTPSPRLEESFENKSSSFAEEGTLAHEFAEFLLTRETEVLPKAYTLKKFKEITEHKLYTDEMPDQVQKHVDYVIQQFSEAKRLTPDAVLLIEKKVDITHLIEEGFGTCDVIIIADGTMEVIDLKYGMGIRVSAEDNSQLKLYASGALEEYEMLYDIHTVRLTITQPRMDSISSWEISTEDLIKWGQEVVKPRALKAYAGAGEQVVGDHCHFCKAAPKCKAQLELAKVTAQKAFTDDEVQLISDEELIDMYAKIPLVKKWFDKVTDHLYQEALDGKKWEGYKLVDGQSRRGWLDEQAAIDVLQAEYDERHYLTTKLKGIGDIEKLVGKKEFPVLLGEVVGFKKTAPSLVPESDKRPALGIDQAKMDYSDDL